MSTENTPDSNPSHLSFRNGEAKHRDKILVTLGSGRTFVGRYIQAADMEHFHWVEESESRPLFKVHTRQIKPLEEKQE